MVVVLVEQLTSKQTHGESIFNNAQVEDFKWLPKDTYRGTKKSKVLKSRLSFFLLQDNSSQYSLDNYRDGAFRFCRWQHVWIIILVVITALAGGSIAA